MAKSKPMHHGWRLNTSQIPTGKLENTGIPTAIQQSNNTRYPKTVMTNNGPIVLDERGRVVVEPNWPAPGEYYVTKEMGDRHYDVHAFTGQAISTVRSGQWKRGQIIRYTTPVLSTSKLGLVMYDPTDTSTWTNPGQGG